MNTHRYHWNQESLLQTLSSNCCVLAKAVVVLRVKAIRHNHLDCKYNALQLNIRCFIIVHHTRSILAYYIGDYGSLHPINNTTDLADALVIAKDTLTQIVNQ